MKWIKYIITINLLYGTSYDIGDTMTYEDQNIEFNICYGGNQQDEIFSFADFNGNLNGGDYKITIVLMNLATPNCAPCESSINWFDNLMVYYFADNPAVDFVEEINETGIGYTCDQWGNMWSEGVPLIVDNAFNYTISEMLSGGVYPAYAILDQNMMVKYKGYGMTPPPDFLEEIQQSIAECGILCSCIISEYSIDSDGDGLFDECDDCLNILGDINEDSAIDILDLVILVNIVLSGGINSTVHSSCELENSNIDQNNTINIVDVISLINLIIANN